MLKIRGFSQSSCCEGYMKIRNINASSTLKDNSFGLYRKIGTVPGNFDLTSCCLVIEGAWDPDFAVLDAILEKGVKKIVLNKLNFTLEQALKIFRNKTYLRDVGTLCMNGGLICGSSIVGLVRVFRGCDLIELRMTGCLKVDEFTEIVSWFPQLETLSFDLIYAPTGVTPEETINSFVVAMSTLKRLKYLCVNNIQCDGWTDTRCRRLSILLGKQWESGSLEYVQYASWYETRN